MKDLFINIALTCSLLIFISWIVVKINGEYTDLWWKRANIIMFIISVPLGILSLIIAIWIP